MTYTSLEQLPLALSAEDVAQVLGISRANTYELMHSEGFPNLKIGKRMTVPKDKLIEGIQARITDQTQKCPVIHLCQGIMGHIFNRSNPLLHSQAP